MGLLSARLMFVERDGDNVLLDVVVLDRMDAPSSPPIGEPLCFAFALPEVGSGRDAVERVLSRWADAMRVVEIDLFSRHGKTRVRLAVADSSLTLEPAVVH